MLATNVLAMLALSSEGGGGSLVDINPGLIVWTAITFLLLLFILKKIAWKPILSALEQRETAIKESLEKAEKAKDEAQRILNENKANLLKAEEESKKIIEQGRIYAEKLKDQVLKESKEQAQKLIQDASAEIERKKEAAFSELKSHIADLVIETTEKVLGETVDKSVHKKIADKYINEIAKN
ncbi:MAG: F0F1 ATP synthase subunit B [Ignavibacteriaceae bacterium]|nr:F0F1 ATP synthase subunit B [Ignavibacteriaceae bacterium]